MSRLYLAVINSVDRFVPAKLRPLWLHEQGPRTVHFWAPMFKWGLVVAGISDITRPPEKLSVYQSTAFALTGTIWSRYSLVITPPNYNFLLVNAFLAITGCVQLTRIYLYRREQERKALENGEPTICNCDSSTTATIATTATTATTSSSGGSPSSS